MFILHLLGILGFYVSLFANVEPIGTLPHPEEVVVPREIQTALQRATKLLEGENRKRNEVHDAIQLLQESILNREDVFLHGDPPHEDTAHHRVLSLMKKLKPEELKLYEVEYGAEAKGLLNKAEEATSANGLPQGLVEVITRFENTQAGLDALNLLGAWYWDHGNKMGAASMVYRMLRHPLFSKKNYSAARLNAFLKTVGTSLDFPEPTPLPLDALIAKQGYLNPNEMQKTSLACFSASAPHMHADKVRFSEDSKKIHLLAEDENIYEIDLSTQKKNRLNIGQFPRGAYLSLRGGNLMTATHAGKSTLFDLDKKEKLLEGVYHFHHTTSSDRVIYQSTQDIGGLNFLLLIDKMKSIKLEKEGIWRFDSMILSPDKRYIGFNYFNARYQPHYLILKVESPEKVSVISSGPGQFKLFDQDSKNAMLAEVIQYENGESVKPWYFSLEKGTKTDLSEEEKAKFFKMRVKASMDPQGIRIHPIYDFDYEVLPVRTSEITRDATAFLSPDKRFVGVLTEGSKSGKNKLCVWYLGELPETPRAVLIPRTQATHHATTSEQK